MTKRDRYLRRVYGLTEAQYKLMLKQQKGTCWICWRPPKPGKNLHVDHVHAKKKKDRRVRGLLCWTCNSRLLGRGRENPDLHRVAADYLEREFDGRMIRSSSISTAPTVAPCAPSSPSLPSHLGGGTSLLPSGPVPSLPRWWLEYLQEKPK